MLLFNEPVFHWPVTGIRINKQYIYHKHSMLYLLILKLYNESFMIEYLSNKLRNINKHIL